jgi:hypothetical protein
MAYVFLYKFVTPTRSWLPCVLQPWVIRTTHACVEMDKKAHAYEQACAEQG